MKTCHYQGKWYTYNMPDSIHSPVTRYMRSNCVKTNLPKLYYLCRIYVCQYLKNFAMCLLIVIDIKIKSHSYTSIAYTYVRNNMQDVIYKRVDMSFVSWMPLSSSEAQPKVNSSSVLVLYEARWRERQLCWYTWFTTLIHQTAPFARRTHGLLATLVSGDVALSSIRTGVRALLAECHRKKQHSVITLCFNTQKCSLSMLVNNTKSNIYSKPELVNLTQCTEFFVIIFLLVAVIEL